MWQLSSFHILRTKYSQDILELFNSSLTYAILVSVSHMEVETFPNVSLVRTFNQALNKLLTYLEVK
jgi:hypothetical protein